VFNLLRVQRDLGASSKLGVAYTDRVDAGNYNASPMWMGLSLRRDLQLSGTVRAELHEQNATSSCTLWHAGINRNGQHLAFSYSLDGVHENFIAGSGYISRPAW